MCFVLSPVCICASSLPTFPCSSAYSSTCRPTVWHHGRHTRATNSLSVRSLETLSNILFIPVNEHHYTFFSASLPYDKPTFPSWQLQCMWSIGSPHQFFSFAPITNGEKKLNWTGMAASVTTVKQTPVRRLGGGTQMLNAVLQSKGVSVLKLNICKSTSVRVNKQINWQSSPFYFNKEKTGSTKTLAHCHSAWHWGGLVLKQFVVNIRGLIKLSRRQKVNTTFFF